MRTNGRLEAIGRMEDPERMAKVLRGLAWEAASKAWRNRKDPDRRDRHIRILSVTMFRALEYEQSTD